MQPGLPLLLPEENNLTVGFNTDEVQENALITRIALVEKQTIEYLAVCPVLKTAANLWEIIVDGNYLKPLDLEDLRDELRTPVQKHRYDQFMEEYATLTNVVSTHLTKHKAFVKAEAYQKEIVAHRNISAVSTDEYIRFSCYTLILCKFFKELFICYLFQHNNEALGNIVHIYHNMFKTVAATDYSKFDGAQNAKTFALEQIIYLSCIAPHHRNEFSLLMNKTTQNVFECGAIKYRPNYTYCRMG